MAWKLLCRNPEGEFHIDGKIIVEGDYLTFRGDREASRVVAVRGKGLCVRTVGMLVVNHPLSNFVGLQCEITFKNDPQGKLPGVE